MMEIETLWVVEACLSVGVSRRYVLIDDMVVARANSIEDRPDRARIGDAKESSLEHGAARRSIVGCLDADGFMRASAQ
jgi:hypothetical protein